MNLYEILGLSSSCLESDIKKAYKLLAQKYHPDKDTGNAEMFKQVKLAYEVLISPDRRTIYDSTGEIKPEIVTIRSEALNKLSELINRMIACVNPKTENLIVKLKLEIAFIKSDTMTKLAETNKTIANINIIQYSIKLKNEEICEENILKNFVDHQLKLTNDDRMFYEKQIKICEIMEEILENYLY